jgi:polysaccharide biosynthesis protein PslH
MRILVLSDKIPTRRLGDGLRAFGLYRPLVGRHRFDLLCYARRGESLEPDIGELFSTVQSHPFPYPSDTSRSTLSRLLGAFSVENFKATTPQMKSEILRRVQCGEVDAIVDLSANMLLCLPASDSLTVPLVVDSIDEPLLRDLRALRIAPWVERPRLARQAFMFWRYERALLTDAEQNIYASELDVAAYRRFFPNRPAIAIPNGVDIDYFTPVSGDTDPATVVFEGNMMFGANVDAARCLVREVLPRLTVKVPDVRVRIVGRDPLPDVLALTSDRVEVTGTVPDVRPSLAKATVFACPMRFGSGIKNKILQAWAMAKPVVATSASLGGLAAHEGDNILIRDGVEAFASAIAEIVRNPAMGQRLGQAGRRTVEREYSWECRAAQFEEVLFTSVESYRNRASSRSRARTAA